MHSTSSFPTSTRPQPLQPEEHTARLAQGVPGPLAAEAGATSCVGKQPSRLPALQRKPRACRLLRSPVPPWFLGTIGCTSRARCCGVCQATACPTALAAAPGASVNPVLDRAADRRAVDCGGRRPRRRAAFCRAKPWPSSSNRSAEAFGYSIWGWSMGLMRMRSAMECRRRSKAAEGLVAMERWWRLPSDRASVGFGRPVRQVPLLGCLLAWTCGGCSQPGTGRGFAAPVRLPAEMHHPCEEYAGRRRPSPGRAPACGDGCVQALDGGGTG
jgi:hypothetical protein